MNPLVTVSLRLTPSLLTQIDHAAASRGMTRSDWIRETLIGGLREREGKEELRALERRLFMRLDGLEEKVMRHLTSEIDSLTREESSTSRL